MTPSECRPGTVVQWDDWVGVVQSTFNNGHKDHRARVSNWERVVPLALPDEVEAYDDQQPGETVDCEDLRLAPRWLVAGEWQVESGEPLRGKLDSGLGAFIWVAYPPRPAEPSAADNLVTMIGGKAPTYLAARQAVERACGVER